MESNQYYDEQEIDLIELLVVILRRWRWILAVGLIFALLLGGLKGVLTKRNLNDSEYLQKVMNNYAYQKETMAANLQKEKLLEEQVHSQQDYMDHSILMNVDPYNAQVAKADLFVKTNYEIMPGMTYQNIDYTNTIIDSYASQISSASFMQQLADDFQIDPRYMKELVQVEQSQNYILSISVTSSELSQADAILDNILSHIEDYKKSITQSIGTHTISILQKSSGNKISQVLADLQETEKTRLQSMRDSLKKVKDEIDKMKSLESEPSVFSLILKAAVKFGAIGFLAGCFLIAGIVTVSFILSDKVYAGKHLTERYQVKMLGRLPRTAASSFFIDVWLDRISNRPVMVTPEVEYELIAANVKNYLGDAKVLLVTGSGSDPYLQEIAAQLADKLKDVHVLAGKNMLRDVATIQELPSCDAVVLVEESQISTYSSVQLELEKVQDMGKKMIGCVMYE